MSDEFRKYYVGSTQEVLFEEQVQIDGIEYYVGYTKEYVKVAAVGKNLENKLVSGTITGVLKDDIYIMGCNF